jgi:hypothetical protein
VNEPSTGGIAVERLMRAIEEEVRRERRARIIAGDGPEAYRDPALFAEVEQALRRAIARHDSGSLLLPELLPDEHEWRPQTYLRLTSHQRLFGGLIVFVKRRLLLPLMRWLYEYSLENFRRQERVNRLLFACIEELAVENAALRQRLLGLEEYGATDSQGPRQR